MQSVTQMLPWYHNVGGKFTKLRIGTTTKALAIFAISEGVDKHSKGLFITYVRSDFVMLGLSPSSTCAYAFRLHPRITINQRTTNNVAK